MPNILTHNTHSNRRLHIKRFIYCIYLFVRRKHNLFLSLSPLDPVVRTRRSSTGKSLIPTRRTRRCFFVFFFFVCTDFLRATRVIVAVQRRSHGHPARARTLVHILYTDIIIIIIHLYLNKILTLNTSTITLYRL